MRQRWWIGVVCLFILGISLAAILFSMPSTLESVAARIVNDCSQKPDDAFCYEKEVPKLSSEYGIAEIFAIIREIRRLDAAYQFCHVLAHKIGEDAVREDPSHWINLISLNPRDGMCSNGFIHGVIVGRFRNDTLDEATFKKYIPDFAQACEPRLEWSPSRIDQAICYHGMGHLFVFITNADLDRSLGACARIAHSTNGDFTRVCREGVFMQTYQPLEPDDFDLLELLPEIPTRENYRRLCAQYSDSADEGACLREAWPLFRSDIFDDNGMSTFCKGQPSEAEETLCYESTSAIIGRQLLGQGAKVSALCDALVPKWQSVCYIAAAQALLEEDRSKASDAIALCGRAKNDVEDMCLKTIASRASWMFLSTSPERGSFCAALPRYKEECMRER